MSKAIYLLGFRGAGKSTLLQALCKSIRCQGLDLDRVLEERLGESILQFVEREGIEPFRKKEEDLLRELDASYDKNGSAKAILATGGGVVDWPASRAILQESPHPKIYLKTPADLLWERLRDDPERRKIRNLQTREQMQALLEERSPFYESLATYTLENQELQASLEALDLLCQSMWQD